MRLCAAVLVAGIGLLVAWIYWILDIFDPATEHGFANWRVYLPLPIAVLAIYVSSIWRDARGIK